MDPVGDGWRNAVIPSWDVVPFSPLFFCASSVHWLHGCAARDTHAELADHPRDVNEDQHANISSFFKAPFLWGVSLVKIFLEYQHSCKRNVRGGWIGGHRAMPIP
jgi:hypothetical protein